MSPLGSIAKKALAILLMVLLLAAPLSLAQDESGYVEPDFEKAIFTREALLLESQEVAATVSALAALASNFPDSGLIDHKLRAKALAIALRLDGTHPGAVAANTKLRDGEKPEALSDFTTLEEVAQQLWTSAGYLESPEKAKDERVVQFCIADIARVIDPENLAESNRYPAQLLSSIFPGWGALLGKGSGTEFEFSPEGGDPDNPPDPDPDPDTPPDPDPDPDNPPDPDPGPNAGTPTRTAQESTVTIGSNSSAAKFSTIVGNLKAGGGTEPLAVVFADEDGQTSQPLNAYRDTMVSALTELQGNWPQDGGVLVLTVKSDTPGDRSMLLSSALLADSLIRERKLDSRVVALGFVAPEGSLMAVDRLHQRLTSLETGEAEIVIVPEDNLPDLQDMLLLGEVETFFRHQILIASTLKEAAAMAAATRAEKLGRSITDFKPVQEIEGDLAGLTSYSAVKKPLTRILELNPRHASTSLLLKHGTGKLPEKLTLNGSLGALHRATVPVISAMQSDDGANLPTAVAGLNAVTKIQPILAPDSEPLGKMMVGLIKNIGTYAGMKPKTSPTATELKSTILTDWESVRSEFGRLKKYAEDE